VSTAEILPVKESELTLNKTYVESSAILRGLMTTRGLAMRNVAPTKDNRAQYFIFVGQRRETPQKQSIDQKTGKPIVTVGSWIAARLEAKGKSTHIRFLGKPNVGGQELCSDADSQLEDAEYWCQNTYIKETSPHFSQMSGREEAQLIRGIVAELKTKASGPMR